MRCRLLVAMVAMVLAGCTTLSQGITAGQRVPESGGSTSSTATSSLPPGSTLAAGSTAPSGTTPTTGPTTAAPRSTMPGVRLSPLPQSDAELAARLLTDVPTEFEREPETEGPLDLAGAADSDGEPGAEAALRSSAFVRGYERTWLGTQEGEINLTVLQHATPEGAQQYLERIRAQVAAGVPSEIRPFSIAGLPAGYLALAGIDQGVAGALTAFGTGPFVVLLLCTGAEVDAVRGVLTRMAVDQLRRLA